MALLIVVITVAVFLSVCTHEFVLWDDEVNVYENPYLNPVTPSKVLHFWQEPYENLYIPLTYSIWAGIAYLVQQPTIEKTGAQFNASPFHATNLILHILGALVVFAILKIFVTNDWAACCGAMLFALHPLQVEPVAWVTGMKDVLCGLFSLVAIWQYLRYVQVRSESHVLSVKRNYVCCTAAFALALLAKPMAVVVPVLAWVLANFKFGYTYFRPGFRKADWTLVTWVIMAIAFLALTKFSQAHALSFITPLWARPLVAGDAVSFYLSKLFVPIRLGIDYGRSPEYVLRHGWILLTGLLPYGLAASLWLLRDRRRWLVVAAGVFGAGLLPVLGLIPFGFQNYSTVADRYLYVSMLGPALALSWLLSSYARSSSGKVAFLSCMLVLGTLGIRSAFQIQYWNNDVKLFTHALAINPGSSSSYNNLGLAFARRGRLDEAITKYSEALRIKPDYEIAHNNMGIVLAMQGKTEEAIVHFRQALRINPEYTLARKNLEVALTGQWNSE